MGLTLELIKGVLVIGGVSLLLLFAFGGATAIWIRRTSKDKVFAFFIEPNRSISTELLSIDYKNQPEKVRAGDGGDYIIDSKKMFWHQWPPGFPEWLKEPIPSAIYVRNRCDPVDPEGGKSIVTAHTLRYMTDEGVLKQTWEDAREAMGEDNSLSKKNISLYVSLAALAGVIIVGYLVWILTDTVNSIAQAIGV